MFFTFVLLYTLCSTQFNLPLIFSIDQKSGGGHVHSFYREQNNWGGARAPSARNNVRPCLVAGDTR